MLWILVSVAAVLAGLGGWTAWRFARRIARKTAAVGTAPAAPVTDLPRRLRDFAERAGVLGDAQHAPRRFAITQDGTMRLRPDGPWLPFGATQTFATGAPEFVWDARFRMFRVMDALVAGDGVLEARLFGIVPVATARDAATTRAQLARYLAELPWVPWAIVANPAITWHEDGDAVTGEARVGDATASITFMFDAAGDIVSVRGIRDRAVPGGSVPTPWVGAFTDHRDFDGARLPARAEVAWEIDGAPFPYFRTEILDTSSPP